MYDGVVPGKYKVLLSKYDSRIMSAPKGNSDPDAPHMIEEKPIIPEIYGDPAKTPLVCTVGTEPGTFQFEVPVLK